MAVGRMKAEWGPAAEIVAAVLNSRPGATTVHGWQINPYGTKPETEVVDHINIDRAGDLLGVPR